MGTGIGKTASLATLSLSLDTVTENRDGPRSNKDAGLVKNPAFLFVKHLYLIVQNPFFWYSYEYPIKGEGT
jgi:hypothetical protein